MVSGTNVFVMMTSASLLTIFVAVDAVAGVAERIEVRADDLAAELLEALLERVGQRLGVALALRLQRIGLLVALLSAYSASIAPCVSVPGTLRKPKPSGTWPGPAASAPQLLITGRLLPRQRSARRAATRRYRRW